MHSFVNSFLLSASYTFASHCVLESLQVNSCPTNTFTLKYLGKDLLGQLGSAVCIRPIGRWIDSNPQAAIPLVSILHGVALSIECCSGCVSTGMFVPVMSITCMMHNISFAGAGALQMKYCANVVDMKTMGADYANLSTVVTIGSTVGTIFALGCTYSLPSEYIPCIFTTTIVLRTGVFNRMFIGK